MKKIITLCSFLYATQHLLCAQCPTDDIVFVLYNQEEVDEFPANYPGCSAMPASFEIWGDVFNVDSLYGITSIGGALSIQETGLTNLEGLSNLTHIDRLFVEYNPLLESLSGLDQLTLIEGRVDVIGNSTLASLEGLNNVTRIGGDVRIWDNNSLFNLNGLNNLDRVNGDFSAADNVMSDLSALSNLTYVVGVLEFGSTALTTLNGLSSLTYAGGFGLYQCSSLINLVGLNNLSSIGEKGFRIVQCSSLVNLTGLESLESISTGINLIENPLLASLSGLENLIAINWELLIINCPSLTSLSALEALIYIGNLRLANNQSLSDCAISAVCTYLVDPPATWDPPVEANAMGCNTIEEVLSNCTNNTKETNPLNQIALKIQPNPMDSKAMLYFELPASTACGLQICDALGVTVLNYPVIDRASGPQELKLNVAGFPAGIYYFRLTTIDGVGVAKVVKH